MTQQPTVQDMLQEFLAGLGFDAMARDVIAEKDPARLRHYARIILRQIPDDRKRAVYAHFATLKLV